MNNKNTIKIDEYSVIRLYFLFFHVFWKLTAIA